MEKSKQVLSTIDAMTSSFNQGDIEGVLRTYEKGAVVVGEPGKTVQGDGPLRAMFEEFIEANAHFTFGAHEVIIAGDIALHLTPWWMSGVAPDGSPLEADGLSVAVLRQQRDDTWLMVIDHPFADAIARARADSSRGAKAPHDA